MQVKSIMNHLGYLAEDLVDLHFISDNVCLTDDRKLAMHLVHLESPSECRRYNDWEPKTMGELGK